MQTGMQYWIDDMSLLSITGMKRCDR